METAIKEKMLCADGNGAYAIDSGKYKCPSCGNLLVPDSEYPDDLLCGQCEKAFDRNTLKEIPWSP